MRAKRAKPRPTIGLLISDIVSSWGYLPWRGATDAARKHDVNLLCFLGGTLRSQAEFGAQANVLYELAGAENADGLIVWAGGLDNVVSQQEFRDFCRRYQTGDRPLPIVCGEHEIEGFPSVLMDDVGSIRQVMTHLIETHGYRKIAFLQGSPGHLGARERYRGYVEILAEYGLPLDPRLVVPEMGDGIARWLLDDQHLRPGVDLEAIVSWNDLGALTALREFQARGVRVPDDVAVVGYDDLAESAVVTPSLTTIHLPFYAMAYQATEMLLALMEGKAVPEQHGVAGSLTVRESCGCVSPAIAEVAVSQAALLMGTSAGADGFTPEWYAETESMLAQTSVGEQIEGWAALLVDSCIADLEEATTGRFLAALEGLLRQAFAAQDNLLAWQTVISILRRQMLPYLAAATVSKAEDLWGQARVLIAGRAQRAEAYRAFEAMQQTAALRALSQSLAVIQETAEVAEILSAQLPGLGIPGFSLALYENPDSPTGWARLLTAYDGDSAVAQQTWGRRFAARRLLPEGAWPRDRRYEMMVHALYFRDRQLGFVLFDSGKKDGSIYESLRGQIASALHSVLLSAQVIRRAIQLQTAAEVSRAASGILDPDDLIHQVVNLVRERFNLYYVGLFLVDQAGEWAVLRAGTSEAGQQMLARGHKLEVGGESMIGWCIANKQARIALDIGEDAVRFENPFLPETRSELALPLVSRGEAIGALTIQSTEQAAFSDEDVAVLQTMADQVANAIDNVSLFNRSQAALREMEATQRRYQQRAWSDYAQVAPVTSYETHPPDRAPLGDKVLPEIQAALERSEPTVLRKPGAGAALVAPITQRGAAIGALGVHLEDAQRELTEDELALVQVVAERVGLVAETLRLLDETQRSATRERTIGEVTSRVRATLDMNTILQTAVREIAQALDAQQAELRLGAGPSSEQ